MYNFIINPKTNKKINIFTNKGNNILKKYLNMVGGASAFADIESTLSPRQKPIIFFDFDKTLAIISVHREVKQKYELFTNLRKAGFALPGDLIKESLDEAPVSTMGNIFNTLRTAIQRAPATLKQLPEINEPLEIQAFKATYPGNIGRTISHIFGSAERIGNLILLLNFLKDRYSLQVITHNWEDLTRYTLSLIGLDKVFDKIIGHSLIRAASRRHTVTEKSQTKLQYINNLVRQKFKCYLIDDTLTNFGTSSEDERLFSGIVIDLKAGIQIETIRNLSVILESLSIKELRNESDTLQPRVDLVLQKQ